MRRPWRIEYRFRNEHAGFDSGWLPLLGNYATEANARKAAAGDLDYYLASISTSREYRFVCVDATREDAQSAAGSSSTTSRITHE